MNFKNFVLAAFLGLVGVAVIAWLSHMSGLGDIDPSYVFDGEPIKDFSAEELAETFKKDPMDAELQYADKGIRVRGEVFDAESSPIRLGSDEGNIACYFPESKRAEVREKISKGQFITIKGLCLGRDKRVRGFVVTLKGCVLEERPSMPQMPIGHP